MSLKKVATTTESLSVGLIISPTIKNWDDMIQLKILSCSAIRAFHSLPFFSLKGSEVKSVPAELWFFVQKMVLASWKRCDHFISMQFPKFFGCDRNSDLSFFRMFVSKTKMIAKILTFSRFRKKFFGCLSMMSIPPGRVFSSEVFSLTFKRACLTALIGCNLGWTSGELFAADLTHKFHIFTSYGLRANWVNSGNNLCYQSLASKSILSQALTETSLKVQRLGTDPNHGNNVPKKTQPERDDIVRTAWRHAEASHKQTRVNKLVTPQDGLTRDNWLWKQYSVTLTVDGFTERVANAGSSAIEDIVEAKKMQAEEALSLKLEQHMFAAAPGSKDLESLATIIASSGTVGGINGTTSTWWGSQVTASGSFAARGRADLTTLYNTIKVLNPVGGPEMFVSDQTSFEAYESSLVSQERFTDNKMVDIGIQNLKFKDTPWTFSPQATSGVIYAIHSGALEFIVNTDTDFLLTPFVTPFNQDARTAKILLACALSSGNRRKLGKLTGVTA